MSKQAQKINMLECDHCEENCNEYYIEKFCSEKCHDDWYDSYAEHQYDEME